MAPRPRRLALTALNLFLLLAITAAVAVAATQLRRTADDPLLIAHNDMRKPAGSLEGGILTVRLVAREGYWYPEGPQGPALPVAAFAEEGAPMQNPGPLLRVPSGTEVHAAIRNALDVPLTIYGLGERRGIEADSVEIQPGLSHEFRFVAAEPGLYYYVGRTMEVPHILERFEDDSQLNGALVIDPPGTRSPPRDRLFMITGWGTFDSTTVSGLGPNPTLAINGAMWPHTERFDVTQGDSLHWRWINPTIIPHPMHLHGFYFRLDSRGDGASYFEFPPELRRLAVTEILPPGGTMALAWSPERPGNWIFHCHFAGHMATGAALEQDRRHPETILASRHAAHATDVTLASHAAQVEEETTAAHVRHDMSGLVIGIRVKPRGRQPSATGEERALRLLLRSRPEVYGEYAGYGYVLGGSPEAEDPTAFSAPGPLLVLEKGQPVAVTLVNETHEAAAVHWHGIELESFPDGVPGWSGLGRDILPAIPPGESFTVRFTPPRAGTFMYHSHFNEFQQIGSGMYGPIVVLEPGETYDPETDRVLVFSDGGPMVNVIDGPFPPLWLNGAERPEPMELRAGVTYRLRLLMIGADSIVEVTLLEGDAPLTWRLVAKDGAELPAAQAATVPARLIFAAGEIYDVEFTPERTGTLTLRFGVPPFAPVVPPPVDVEVNVR